ncbi:MAG: hypothetical protein Q9182_004211 [Xanthomendoza sp. 2 TL-2023]
MELDHVSLGYMKVVGLEEGVAVPDFAGEAAIELDVDTAIDELLLPPDDPAFWPAPEELS